MIICNPEKTMNDTPRMTEAWSKASRTADGMYSSRPCHIDIAANCYKEGCELERELTVARRLAERYRYLSCDSQEEADAEVLPWENNQTNEL
jgi:hypothetical protein